MGYSPPPPPNAQAKIDESVRIRLQAMHARGEKVRTLEDMFREHGRP